MLANGGFEDGQIVPWTEVSQKPLLGDFRAHDGSFHALLGDGFERGVDEQLYQDFAIPAEAGSVTLNYYWGPVTRETDGQEHDTLTVSLLDLNGQELAALDHFANMSSPYNMASHDLAEFAGQAVRLHFHVITNADNDSDFAIDDVSVMACSE